MENEWKKTAAVKGSVSSVPKSAVNDFYGAFEKRVRELVSNHFVNDTVNEALFMEPMEKMQRYTV